VILCFILDLLKRRGTFIDEFYLNMISFEGGTELDRIVVEFLGADIE
jgi:hypothetical protein